MNAVRLSAPSKPACVAEVKSNATGSAKLLPTSSSKLQLAKKLAKKAFAELVNVPGVRATRTIEEVPLNEIFRDAELVGAIRDRVAGPIWEANVSSLYCVLENKGLVNSKNAGSATVAIRVKLSPLFGTDPWCGGVHNARSCDRQGRGHGWGWTKTEHQRGQQEFQHVLYFQLKGPAGRRRMMGTARRFAFEQPISRHRICDARMSTFVTSVSSANSAPTSQRNAGEGARAAVP